VLTRNGHPCLTRDSYPQSQQASGRRPTLETAQRLGSAANSTRTKREQRTLNWGINPFKRRYCRLLAGFTSMTVSKQPFPRRFPHSAQAQAEYSYSMYLILRLHLFSAINSSRAKKTHQASSCKPTGYALDQYSKSTQFEYRKFLLRVLWSPIPSLNAGILITR
jgi:hypothetical protein